MGVREKEGDFQMSEATGGFTSEFLSLWAGCLHPGVKRADVVFWPHSLVDYLREVVIFFMLKAALLLDLPQGHSHSQFQFLRAGLALLLAIA